MIIQYVYISSDPISFNCIEEIADLKHVKENTVAKEQLIEMQQKNKREIEDFLLKIEILEAHKEALISEKDTLESKKVIVFFDDVDKISLDYNKIDF